jgi:hypothetical protein
VDQQWFTGAFPFAEALKGIVPALQEELTAQLKAKHTEWLQEQERVATDEAEAQRLIEKECKRSRGRSAARRRFAMLMQHD